MASKGPFNAAALARIWDADASTLEHRVRRAEPEDTPVIRKVLSARATALRRCAADLRREAARD